MAKTKRSSWYKTRAVGVIGFDEQNDAFTLTGEIWEKGEGTLGMKFDRKPSRDSATIYIHSIERSVLKSLLGKVVILHEEAKRDGSRVDYSVRIRTAS